MKRRGKISDKLGKKFGRLTVISTTPRFWNEKRYTLYNCVCDCGKEVTTQLINTLSCGCLQKEQLILRNRKELGFAAETAVWNYYKRNAKTRNLKWELSREEFKYLITQSCYYCNVDPNSLFETPEGSQIVKSGIDRKNNDLGYNIDNCVSCCKICNRAKGTLTEELFNEWLNRLSSRKRGV